MNIFKRMFYSMRSIRKYPEMIQSSMFRIVLYGIFISGLTIAILFGAAYFVFRTTYGTLDQIAEKMVPEFELKDRSLHFDAPILFNESYIYVNIDTSEPGAFDGLSMEKIADMSAEYVNMAIADKNKAVIFNAGQLTIYEFKDLKNDVHYNKQSLMEDIPFVRMVMTIIFVFIAIMMIVIYFVTVLLFSLTETLFVRMFGVRHKFSTVFKVTVHASTPALAFYLIANLFGFSFFVGNWIMLLILFITMQMALRQVQLQNKRLLTDEESQKTNLQSLQNRNKDRDEFSLNQAESEFIKKTKDTGFKSGEDFMGSGESGDVNAGDENGMQNAVAEEKSDYMRHQPDVIIPSSGWSFGGDEKTKE